MDDSQLYAKFRHTVGCRVVTGDEEASAEWYDLDVYSDAEDPKTALETYLAGEFGEAPAAKKGVWTVEDPDGLSIVRHYRLAD